MKLLLLSALTLGNSSTSKSGPADGPVFKRVGDRRRRTGPTNHCNECLHVKLIGQNKYTMCHTADSNTTVTNGYAVERRERRRDGAVHAQ